MGVVVERINTGGSWVGGRSRCDACGKTLRAFDIVPVLSYAAARGRCRMCGTRVSWYGSASEIVLGTLFVLAYLKLGLSNGLPVFLFLLSSLLATVLYDLRHMFVPRPFFLAVAGSALVFAVLVAPSAMMLGAWLLGATAIGLAFFLLFFLSGGRAMGLGDAPIALSLSLAAGSAALSGLIFSFWIGAVVGIGLLVLVPRTRRMGVEVPFVPFLAAGFLLAYFTTWEPFSIIASLLGT